MIRVTAGLFIDTFFGISTGYTKARGPTRLLLVRAITSVAAIRRATAVPERAHVRVPGKGGVSSSGLRCRFHFD